MERSGGSSNNVPLPVAPEPNLRLSLGTMALARGFCRVRIGVFAGIDPDPTSGALVGGLWESQFSNISLITFKSRSIVLKQTADGIIFA